MSINSVRHCCYMLGEDLGITGIKAIENFPADDKFEQIIFMVKLFTDLENKDKDKFIKRKKYIFSVLK